MKISTLFSATLFAFAGALSVTGHAQDKPVVTPITTVSEMSEGEVRKVDKDTKKITIKHGVIKNLDMPGMTMVFQVKDTAMLDKVKAGDKVKFAAEKVGGAIVVTEIETSK